MDYIVLDVRLRSVVRFTQYFSVGSLVLDVRLIVEIFFMMVQCVKYIRRR